MTVISSLHLFHLPSDTEPNQLFPPLSPGDNPGPMAPPPPPPIVPSGQLHDFMGSCGADEGKMSAGWIVQCTHVQKQRLGSTHVQKQRLRSMYTHVQKQRLRSTQYTCTRTETEVREYIIRMYRNRG